MNWKTRVVDSCNKLLNFLSQRNIDKARHLSWVAN